jgi:hypothetical protein
MRCYVNFGNAQLNFIDKTNVRNNENLSQVELYAITRIFSSKRLEWNGNLIF